MPTFKMAIKPQRCENNTVLNTDNLLSSFKLINPPYQAPAYFFRHDFRIQTIILVFSL